MDEALAGLPHQAVGPNTTAVGEVAFPPLDLFHGTLPNGKPKCLFLGSCLAVGPGLDFILGPETVFLMKEKGVAKPVWESRELNANPNRACYDGRYLWFSVERLRQVPRLLV